MASETWWEIKMKIENERKKSKWNENEMLQLILQRNRTVSLWIHNDSINEFHRVDEMEFMSIEWGKLSPMCAFMLSLSFSQSVSQCGVTVGIVIRNAQLLCQKHSNIRIIRTVQIIVNYFLLLTCDLKSNAIIVSYDGLLTFHQIKSVWYNSNYQQWKMYLYIIVQSDDGVIGGRSGNKESIFQLHFCFCSLKKRRKEKKEKGIKNDDVTFILR